MSEQLREERITISGKVSIGATITHTDDNAVSPAIILIMGTGKTDRDGNDKSFKTDIYKNLAKMFADEGYVVFRYDKRGTFETEGNYNTASLNDLVDDAISVIRYAKSLPYIDGKKIIVCGHSEGTMIATLLSTKEDTAGLILLGGAAMCMKDALLYQNHLAAKEFENKKGLIGMLLRSQTSPEKTDPKVNAMFEKCASAKKDRVFFGGVMLNANWLKDHASYSSDDFVQLLKEYGKPVLAITGTADLSADYSRLSELEDIPFTEVYTPNNVNHILREIDDDNSIMNVKKQYKRLAAQPIHKETKKTILTWLNNL